MKSSSHDPGSKEDYREMKESFFRLMNNDNHLKIIGFFLRVYHPLFEPLVRANHPIAPITYNTTLYHNLAYPSFIASLKIRILLLFPLIPYIFFKKLNGVMPI